MGSNGGNQTVSSSIPFALFALFAVTYSFYGNQKPFKGSVGDVPYHSSKKSSAQKGSAPSCLRSTDSSCSMSLMRRSRL